MKKLLIFCLISILSPSIVQAADLMDVYTQALENDTAFKEAYETYMAQQEAVPQARAALYPQVNINSGVTRTVDDNRLGGDNVENYFVSNLWQVSATQAIFNYQAWAATKQAKASVRAAQAKFNDAAQDLILRTAQAYFATLLSEDTLEFALAKKRANHRQLNQAKQRFNVGLDAITSVYEAQAAYDQSVAEVISARNNKENENERLRKLTNHVYDNISPLRNKKIPLVRPEPDDVNAWINVGIKQNYLLYYQKYLLLAAKENIKNQAAGSWPVFSIQGNASQTHREIDGRSSVFAPTRSTNAYVGLSMNFPIVQGGLVQSQTRQAQHEYSIVSEQFERQYRDIIVESRIAFNTILDGISKVKADRQTVISQQNSVESTEAQFEVGTRTMVDVVNAQQKLFDAQRELARDQYGLINALLRLKYLAGTLNVNDLEQINSWLDTLRINAFPKNCDKKPAQVKVSLKTK